MTKKESKAERLFPKIIEEIEKGNSLFDACKLVGISTVCFYKLLDEEKNPNEIERENFVNKYARACEERDEREFEEILKIADGDEDGKPVKDSMERIARDRLRIDARKWRLAKRRPKKYGDKVGVDLTSEGEKVSINLNLGSDEDDKE